MRKALRHFQQCSNIQALSHIVLHTVYLFILSIVCVATMRHMNAVAINNNLVGLKFAQDQISSQELDDFYNIYQTNRQMQAEFTMGTTNVHVYSHTDNSWITDVVQCGEDFYWLLKGNIVDWTQFKSTYIWNTTGQLYIWHHTEYQNNRMTMWDYVLAGTLIAPALIVMLILLFVLASKIILFCLRTSLMYFLELMTERNPKDIIPFTLLAGAADIVLIFLKMLAQLSHFIITRCIS